MSDGLRWTALDSVVFDTERLADVRAFYESILMLPIARYVKDGAEIEDVTDRHVNYRIGASLIGFEVGGQTEIGSLVLRVASLDEARTDLLQKGVVQLDRGFFIRVQDPDGRRLIIEQQQQ